MSSHRAVRSQTGSRRLRFRWLHILVGITWIGLLYYFNFVQVPAFAGVRRRAPRRATSPSTRWPAARCGGSAGRRCSRSSTGSLIIGVTEDYFANDFGKPVDAASSIRIGMLLGIIMCCNVWGVIWRNQKIVLANAVNVLNGGEADPNAAAAGRARAAGLTAEHDLLGVDAVVHGRQGALLP